MGKSQNGLAAGTHTPADAEAKGLIVREMLLVWDRESMAVLLIDARRDERFSIIFWEEGGVVGRRETGESSQELA